MVLLNLPAISCGLFPFERNFPDEAALTSGRKFSREEADDESLELGGESAPLIKGPWAELTALL